MIFRCVYDMYIGIGCLELHYRYLWVLNPTNVTGIAFIELNFR